VVVSPQAKAKRANIRRVRKRVIIVILLVNLLRE